MTEKIEVPSNMPNLLRERLSLASEAELARIRDHLSLGADADAFEIERAYISAADNSVFEAVRGVVRGEAPTYSKVLRLIYKELRPYSEALDHSWRRVKSLRLSNYTSPLDQLSDAELENMILKLYEAEYRDVSGEVERQQRSAMGKLLKPVRNVGAKLARWMPGAGGAAVSSAVTVSAHTAARLPFAAAAPGVVAGPVGIALSVVLVGTQLAGPAYRKIIPATVELMLIGQRIAHMPEE